MMTTGRPAAIAALIAVFVVRAASAAEEFAVTHQDGRWTDQGSTYSTYSWVVEITSYADHVLDCYLEYELLDDRGIRLDYSNETGTVEPGHRRDFRDEIMIKTTLAEQVVSSNVSARCQ